MPFLPNQAIMHKTVLSGLGNESKTETCGLSSWLKYAGKWVSVPFPSNSAETSTGWEVGPKIFPLRNQIWWEIRANAADTRQSCEGNAAPSPSICVPDAAACRTELQHIAGRTTHHRLHGYTHAAGTQLFHPTKKHACRRDLLKPGELRSLGTQWAEVLTTASSISHPEFFLALVLCPQSCLTSNFPPVIFSTSRKGIAFSPSKAQHILIS